MLLLKVMIYDMLLLQYIPFSIMNTIYTSWVDNVAPITSLRNCYHMEKTTLENLDSHIQQ